LAGLGMRDIKRRIKSVKSTRQITKAMEMVASAKLRKSRKLLESSRPFTQAWRKAMIGFLGELLDTAHPLVTPREAIQQSGYIVIAGNRGLCGGYNTNVMKTAMAHMKDKESVKVITVGLKSRDYFDRRDIDSSRAYTDISELPDYIEAQDIRRFCLEEYRAGRLDEIYLVYTHFDSTISYQPRILKLLPMDGEALDTCCRFDEELLAEQEMEKPKQNEQFHELVTYEPSPSEVLDHVIPSYIDSMILSGLIESGVSEQAARRVAMENATNNAEDMIDRLQLQYNRARQAAITQEIAEIVGGAEALK
jgi:F-type H+-transporting ATPase subunit gamma